MPFKKTNEINRTAINISLRSSWNLKCDCSTSFFSYCSNSLISSSFSILNKLKYSHFFTIPQPVYIKSKRSNAMGRGYTQFEQAHIYVRGYLCTPPYKYIENEHVQVYCTVFFVVLMFLYSVCGLKAIFYWFTSVDKLMVRDGVWNNDVHVFMEEIHKQCRVYRNVVRLNVTRSRLLFYVEIIWFYFLGPRISFMKLTTKIKGIQNWKWGQNPFRYYTFALRKKKILLVLCWVWFGLVQL